MTGQYTHLNHIKQAVEQRMGRTVSQLEFEILLIRGHGQFWELTWQTGGFRLLDSTEIQINQKALVVGGGVAGMTTRIGLREPP